MLAMSSTSLRAAASGLVKGRSAVRFMQGSGGAHFEHGTSMVKLLSISMYRAIHSERRQ
jgi:hypothetical protein